MVQWLEETLLKYLDNWQKRVENNKDIPDGSKKHCLLPDQTVEAGTEDLWYVPLCI